jgi:hypothetical protein
VRTLLAQHDDGREITAFISSRCIGGTSGRSGRLTIRSIVIALSFSSTIVELWK